MKVAVIFNTGVGHTTGWYIYRAFLELGYDAYAVHNSKIKELSGYDLYFIVDSTEYYDIPRLDGETIYYAIDVHIDFWNRYNMAKTADYACMAQLSAGVNKAKENGLQVYWLPLGCDPYMHADLLIEKTFDIASVMTMHGHDKWRVRINDLLKGYTCRIGPASHLEISNIYSSAIIGLNHTFGDYGTDVNMRVFEVMSCGAYLITNKMKNDDMKLMFPDDLYSEYDSDDEMFEQIEKALNNKNKAKEAKMYVRSKYTYARNLERMLKEI